MDIPHITIEAERVLRAEGQVLRFTAQVEAPYYRRIEAASWIRTNEWLREHGVPRNTARAVLADATEASEHPTE